jgi:hypothetical protein
MILDLPLRLVVAYGLIALILLTVAGGVVWMVRNTPQRRNARDNARQAEYYRKRDDKAAAAAALER